MKKKILEKDRGITLIALVITIIVLLILAGISISMLSGDNSILQRATEARERTGTAQTEEQVKLATSAALLDGKGLILYTNLNTELKEQFGTKKYSITPEEDAESWTVTIGEEEYIITKGGNAEISPEPEEGSLLAMYLQAQKDKCTKTSTTCNNVNHLHIGDYVDYKPSNMNASITIGKDGVYNGDIKDTTITDVGTGNDTKQTYIVDTTSNYKTTWRVLGLSKDKKHIKLISGSPIKKTGDDPYLILQSAEGYFYCKKTLNLICSIYSNSDLADEVRSVAVEDINSALGIEVEYREDSTNTDGTKTPNKVYQISDNGKRNIDGYNARWFRDYEKGDYAPENYLGIGTLKNVGDRLYRNSYFYYLKNLTGIDQRVKGILFDGATSYEDSKSYWLASSGFTTQIAKGGVNYTFFAPGGVDYGGVMTCMYDLFDSTGAWSSYARGVRPIVLLKSAVKTTDISIKTDAEEKTWPTKSGERDRGKINDNTKTIGYTSP